MTHCGTYTSGEGMSTNASAEALGDSSGNAFAEMLSQLRNQR